MYELPWDRAGVDIAIIAYMLGCDFQCKQPQQLYLYYITHFWARNPTPAPKPTICQ